MEKKLVIFDLDGTLIDSVGDLKESVNHALATLGFPIQQSILQFVGNGTKMLLKRSLPAESATEETIVAAQKIFREHYDIHNTDKTLPYKGIPQMLLSLTKRGMMVAVASNKYQSATEKIVSVIFPNVKFSSILGQREGLPIKPDPQIVYDIMKECNITDKNTILYVGDGTTDMETAINAGVDCCAVTWGFKTLEQLSAYNPTHIAYSPIDILQFV